MFSTNLFLFAFRTLPRIVTIRFPEDSIIYIIRSICRALQSTSFQLGFRSSHINSLALIFVTFSSNSFRPCVRCMRRLCRTVKIFNAKSIHSAIRALRFSLSHVYSIPTPTHNKINPFFQGKKHSLKTQSKDSLDKDGDNKADKLNSLDNQVHTGHEIHSRENYLLNISKALFSSSFHHKYINSLPVPRTPCHFKR